MKIAIVFNDASSGSADAADVLNEVRLVSDAMTEEAHDVRLLSITGKTGKSNESLYNLSNALADEEFDLVYNLFDGFEGNPLSQHYVRLLLNSGAIPVTGSGAEAILATTDKILAKKIMVANNIPTPKHFEYCGGNVNEIAVNFPVILKPAYEDASVGIEDFSVMRDRETLLEILPNYYREYNRQPVIIEEFIEGREFHVSLLEKENGEIEALPVAETIFDKWEEGKPKIVGYRAKWEPESPEYQNTLRRFNSADIDGEELKRVSHACWNAFKLRGYARVDLRMDAKGNPFVIEVNANPCLSPDAGFVAAAKEAALEVNDVVKRIARCALGVVSGAAQKKEAGENLQELTFREVVTLEDRSAIAEIVESTGNFTEEEIAVALELVDDVLTKGRESEYRFLIADMNNVSVGYVCYGWITVTKDSYDVFWIATRKEMQGRGIGQALLQKTEELIFSSGGRNVILETSSTPKYVLTRKFYRKMGYREVAHVPHFYGENDAKVVYMKRRG